VFSGKVGCSAVAETDCTKLLVVQLWFAPKVGEIDPMA